MGTGQQRENRLLRHGKAGMHAGLPGPAPSLQRPVRKIPGLESTNNEPPAALDARGRGLWRRRERQAERVLPEGKLWRQAFELNKPFLFIIGVRGGRFGGLVYPLIL